MDTSREDGRASRDPGVISPPPTDVGDVEVAGHRTHTVYERVHLPGEKRQRKHKLPRTISQDSIEDEITPPALRVQTILGEDAGDTQEIHPLFSEMEELYQDDKCVEWREYARWVKFEEDVEDGGNRWSKPHVGTLSLHALFELRSLLLNGTVMLDMEAVTLDQVSDLLLDHTCNSGALREEAREKVREILLKRHKHLHERRKEASIARLPLIRRNHSSSKRMSSPEGRGGEGTEESHGYANLNGEHKRNLGFMRKIPPGAEAANILVGEVDFLDKPLSAFIRFRTSREFGDLTEVPVPTRFMFILLVPSGGMVSYHEIGRAMGTLMSDEVFHEVAYRAKARSHILAAVDEFLDAVTVLPPGEWDPAIRIEPPPAVPSQDPRKRPESMLEQVDPEILEQKLRQASGLTMSGRLFGGLINDIKRKAPWYWSDFKDALAMQCIASWIFLYFACLSPIITFGGLLSEATGKNIAAIESLVSGFVCGIGYGFFSGQPLSILGSTGPVLVFETIVYDFCMNVGWDYLSLRLWIGLWIAFILFILVAVDASAMVCYITRFTEENFAILIALIFIIKAVENVIRIGQKYPLDTHRGDLNHCLCEPPSLIYPLDTFNWTTLDRDTCLTLNGTLSGLGCSTKSVPDVFLMSIVLFFGTFSISIILKDFKTALFFPTKVRQFVSDFAVIIAIVSMTLVDYTCNVPTPKLEVPSEFKPTLPGRGWVVSPFKNPVWTIPLASLPALLGTILIFMDQQITAVIVNRRENKLRKGCGYHLDLFVLCVLIAICSVMGLPWFVAATVLSINHVNSLKLETECAAPGDKPQFLGVREQRVTHILIFLMIGLSVTITPYLRHIPMPVLFGVFLYMGISSLKGLQFYNRMIIMFMPAKYQPDLIYLRKVPIQRVHLFTAVQFSCLVMLWVIKSFSQTSILFPLMLVVMVGIRKLLDFVFTQRELKYLDDVMPTSVKGRQDDQEENNTDVDDSLQASLLNGTIMKIPVTSINISEEVPKTGIWKHVNNNKNEIKQSSIKLKKRKSSKEASTDEERMRLAPMAEMEEDDGRVTIKVDKARNLTPLKDRNDFYPTIENGNETTV